MRDSELRVHRANTTAFVAERPSRVVLVPYERVRNTAGGFKDVAGDPREPQTFRIVELGMRSTPASIRTQDGTMREVRYWLLGEWDAAVEVGDRWTEDGKEFEVGDIVRPNGYETRALVVERG